MTKYIYAVGLHNEGGLNILNRFLSNNNDETIFFLDTRLNIEKKKNYIFIESSLIKRIFHFIKLKRLLKKDDHIFFLNGLPPFIKLKCKVSVAFQNANIFREFYSINFYQWLMSKDSIRYFNFILNSDYVDNWYIFSPVAQEILKKYVKKYVNLKIINIYEKYQNLSLNNFEKNKTYKYDFIYPASLMKHKNHKLLLNILIDLSKIKIYPKVLITLDDKSLSKINFNKIKNKYNLNLYNMFEKDHQKFLEVYNECRYLLYLSSNETIGLPILEAYSYGLQTIVPNLKYSSQFISPDYLFDLDSKKEITNVIIKCLNQSQNTKNNKDFKYLKNSISIDEFVNNIL